jgi:hypothetical protein
MAKVFRKYRHFARDSEHSERFFSSDLPYLMVLSAILIVQITTAGINRILTLCCFLIAIWSWYRLLRSARAGGIRAYWTGSVGILILACCVSFPPATSKDVNSYALYGQIAARYHTSPYTHLPRDFAADSWYHRTSAYWSDSPSVYGPAFTGISRAIMEQTGSSVTETRLAFQMLAAASLLAATALVARKLTWPVAWVAVLMNPLLITFGVNDAHCDVLIGALILAGVLALERRRLVVAAVVLALAALVKISLLPALFGAFVWLWFRVSRRAACLTAFVGAIVFSAGLVLNGGIASLSALHQASLRHTRFSVWNPVHIVLTDLFGSGLPTHTTADVLVSMLANLAVAGAGLAVLWRTRNNSSPLIPIISIVVAYQVLGAYTLSWYAIWSVPSLMLLIPTATNVRSVSPLLLAMGHGCWLAVAYLSGYGVIAVTVFGIVCMVRYRARLHSSPSMVGAS